MGIGRGDSSRRVDRPQARPVAEFEARCAMIKDLMNGRPVDWNEQGAGAGVGAQGRARHPDVHRRLRAEGACRRGARRGRRDHPARRPGDHPVDHGQARKAAEEAGRDPAELKCMSARRAHIGDDIADGASRCAGSRRWSRTMSSTCSRSYGPTRPAAGADRLRQGAQVLRLQGPLAASARSTASSSTDETCDRFCILGTPEQRDREAARARGGRRRPVQHLPDDPGPGRDARGLRRARSSRSSPQWPRNRLRPGRL